MNRAGCLLRSFAMAGAPSTYRSGGPEARPARQPHGTAAGIRSTGSTRSRLSLYI